MSDYIASCTLEVNGQKISDFKAVTEGAREIRKQFKKMGGTGFITTSPLLGVSVDYLVPQVSPYDWDALTGGTLTIVYEGGRTVVYTGVSTLSVGEAKADAENEMVQTVQLGAEARKEV